MKRKFFNVLTLVFTINLFFAFYDFSAASAQVVPANPNRPRSVSPSPSPVKIVSTPTPKPLPTAAPTVSPSVSPTPNAIDDPNEIIKIETEEVNLNVRVIDRGNRPINNLRQQEFKVYENSVLQPITSFAKAEVPANYSLVIDNSGSLRALLDKVIEAGKIIVNTNKPGDETSIIRFVGKENITIEQDFTSNKADLNDALDNLFVEGGQTAIIDAVYLAAETVNKYENSRNPNDKKRRALILVSDGEDRDSYYKEAQLFELLRETDVQIYTVGFVSELSKEGGFIGKSPQGKAKALLERLATETGGKSYFPNSPSELNTIAQDIASELRTQYLVSYSPTNDKKDGSFRAIKVVVDDGPNKQKRIAVTRTGRNSVGERGNAPTLQKSNPQVKSN